MARPLVRWSLSGDDYAGDRRGISFKITPAPRFWFTLVFSASPSQVQIADTYRHLEWLSVPTHLQVNRLFYARMKA